MHGCFINFYVDTRINTHRQQIVQVISFFPILTIFKTFLNQGYKGCSQPSDIEGFPSTSGHPVASTINSLYS